MGLPILLIEMESNCWRIKIHAMSISQLKLLTFNRKKHIDFRPVTQIHTSCTNLMRGHVYQNKNCSIALKGVYFLPQPVSIENLHMLKLAFKVYYYNRR